MKKTSFALVLLSTLLLQACSNVQSFYDKAVNRMAPKEAEFIAGTDPNCPKVGVTPGLNSLTQIRDDKVVSETIFADVSSSCKLTSSMATIRLNIGFKGRLGTLGIEDAKTEANYSIPYMIVVVDKDSKIISKEVFTINMIYKNGHAEQALTDIIEQDIKLSEGLAAKEFKVMLGFQLNDLELAYNKLNNR